MDDNKVLELIQEIGVLKQQNDFLKQQFSSMECLVSKLTDRVSICERSTDVISSNVSQIKETITEFKTQQVEANKNILSEIQQLKDDPGNQFKALKLNALSTAIGWLIAAAMAAIFIFTKK